MSTGVILTVLSNIPWGQVVENAPKLADGAAKLWSTVTGFRKPPLPAAETPGSAGNDLPSDTAILETRVLALEETVRGLQDQMKASSELIKALADQNTQLVQRIELNRIRLGRVTAAAASCGLALLAAIAYLLLRH
ncbi:MAG: hypothetical protein V4540_01760 [Pseudomonadota bacterium]